MISCKQKSSAGDAKNAPNLFFTGALPRTSLGELTTLPQISAREGDTLPIPHPSTPAAPHFKGGTCSKNLER